MFSCNATQEQVPSDLALFNKTDGQAREVQIDSTSQATVASLPTLKLKSGKPERVLLAVYGLLPPPPKKTLNPKHIKSRVIQLLQLGRLKN